MGPQAPPCVGRWRDLKYFSQPQSDALGLFAPQSLRGAQGCVPETGGGRCQPRGNRSGPPRISHLRPHAKGGHKVTQHRTPHRPLCLGRSYCSSKNKKPRMLAEPGVILLPLQIRADRNAPGLRLKSQARQREPTRPRPHRASRAPQQRSEREPVPTPESLGSQTPRAQVAKAAEARCP